MLRLLPKAILLFASVISFMVLNGCSKDDEIKHPGAIAGIVAEEGNGDAVLSGVQIILNNGYYTFTDEAGKFEFARLLPGRYSLQCYVNGYVMESFPVNAFDGEKTLCEIEMKKGSNVLSVSSTIFDFGTDVSVRNLTMHNNSGVNKPELVTIETLNPDSWLTVSSESVTLNTGESAIIELKADRSLVKKNEKSIISIKGLNKTILVLASIKYKAG